MQYNPFNKSLEDLTSGDLQILIDDRVAEGYSIEYKSDFQTPIKIAKSISSFANTLGGWYFIGIEADKVDNIATRINGIDLQSVSDPLAKLRDSVKSNVDPLPFFEQRLIPFGSGKAVLVVKIPDNQDTPFITRDGKIYRRANDSSDPLPEASRHAVDRLVDNGRELSRRFDAFCKDERTFSKDERNQGWVNIYLSPYPLGNTSKTDMFSESSIEKLIRMSKSPIEIYGFDEKNFGSSTLIFNSGQLGVASIILRQVNPPSIAFNCLTLELFMDGKAKISVPLSNIPNLLLTDIRQFKSPKVVEALENISATDEDHSLSLLNFFDIHQLFGVVTHLLNFYEKWYETDIGRVDRIRTQITLENIWRAVPFIDTDEWGSFVMNYGLPTQHSKSLALSSGMGKGVLLTSPLYIAISPLIGTMFGLPLEKSIEIITKPYTENKTG